MPNISVFGGLPHFEEIRISRHIGHLWARRLGIAIASLVSLRHADKTETRDRGGVEKTCRLVALSPVGLLLLQEARSSWDSWSVRELRREVSQVVVKAVFCSRPKLVQNRFEETSFHNGLGPEGPPPGSKPRSVGTSQGGQLAPNLDEIHPETKPTTCKFAFLSKNKKSDLQRCRLSTTCRSSVD